MKHLIAIILFSVMIFAETYTVDQQKSYLGFEATKFVFVDVEGKFSSFKGQIETDDDNIVKIMGSIDVASLDTGNTDRDEDLRSEGYFHTDAYPKMIFVSNTVTDTHITGTLIIKAIAHDINLTIDEKSITDQGLILKMHTEVDRQVFNLNGFLSAVINDIVNLKIELAAK